MLSIFPIQFLAPLAFMLLRICVGFIFINFAQTHLRNRDIFQNVFSLPILPFGRFFTWYIIIAEVLIGVSFILGLFTQIAALLAMAYATKFLLFYPRFTHPLGPTRQTLTLLFFVALSLCITGPGILAFDLPI